MGCVTVCEVFDLLGHCVLDKLGQIGKSGLGLKSSSQ